MSDRHLPADWDDTEAALRHVVERVINFQVYWRQNHESSVELFKALLAEIEGFGWLLANFDVVEALRFEPRAGGSAPEAIAWRAGVPYLFEIKSLGAFGLRPHNDFHRLPPHSSVFPPQRTSTVSLRSRSFRRADCLQIWLGEVTPSSVVEIFETCEPNWLTRCARPVPN